MKQSEIAAVADFSSIRYAQCWEDADILLRALKVKASDHCLSIASAGDNTLALVGAGAAKVIAVDLNPAQIACLELRVACYRRLQHREFLRLLGQSPSRHRWALYRRCRSELSSAARHFWDERRPLVEKGIARSGKFERYLDIFRRYLLPLIHGKRTVGKLFELHTAGERREFYERQWNNRRWKFLCKLFFSHAVLGRLGRAPGFTTHADEPIWQNLERRIPTALVEQDPGENPYLQWILTGHFRNCLPYAMRPENFTAIRDNLDALELRCASLEQVVAGLPDASLDACNLSDIFEYLSAPAYQVLLRELIRAGAPGCRLVYWNLVVDRRCPTTLQPYLREKREFAKALHQQDKAFFYRDLIIEEVA